MRTQPAEGGNHPLARHYWAPSPKFVPSRNPAPAMGEPLLKVVGEAEGGRVGGDAYVKGRLAHHHFGVRWDAGCDRERVGIVVHVHGAVPPPSLRTVRCPVDDVPKSWPLAMPSLHLVTKTNTLVRGAAWSIALSSRSPVALPRTTPVCWSRIA
jgi:hypothetical protein